jgi:hypothetical protein
MRWPQSAQYLSWLADIVIFSCCALCIRLVLVRYVDWSFLHEVLELQWVHIQATVAAGSLRRPSPESIIGPYQCLPGPEWIRLCKVHDDDDGGLYLRLEKLRLADAPPYNAPSYSCGPAEGVPGDGDANALNLTVSGQDHPITKNLARALMYLRDINSTRYYWIGAICIIQLDDAERSSQVNTMDQIYQKVETVDIWLGNSDAETVRIVTILSELVEAKH